MARFVQHTRRGRRFRRLGAIIAVIAVMAVTSSAAAAAPSADGGQRIMRPSVGVASLLTASSERRLPSPIADENDDDDDDDDDDDACAMNCGCEGAACQVDRLSSGVAARRR